MLITSDLSLLAKVIKKLFLFSVINIFLDDLLIKILELDIVSNISRFRNYQINFFIFVIFDWNA